MSLGMPVALRTLDVGGDKPLSYFPIYEANPFLGWRGVRITLDHPEIFVTQVRAMIRANVGTNNLEILLPMISGKSEVDESLVLINRVRAEIEEEVGEKIRLPKIGAMIEVPSAVYQIEDICSVVDFVSIGTNDLTQFTLGISRDDSGKFLPEYVGKGIWPGDPFISIDPVGVKRIMQIAVEDGRATRPDLKVGICGEHGGEAKSIAICHGLGLNYVSCSPYRVPVARLAAAQAKLAADSK